MRERWGSIVTETSGHRCVTIGRGDGNLCHTTHQRISPVLFVLSLSHDGTPSLLRSITKIPRRYATSALTNIGERGLKKGNRPSYIHAAGHDVAIPLYELFCEKISSATGKSAAKGVFGADMQVELINDGPVTIIIDSRLKE
ncbi:MAG: D-aminoacyl-tRNA deacylase [Bacteroidales bacterium]|nr:D-aminoacyl-tRNA deacylase [Bacteroidales bacterium]